MANLEANAQEKNKKGKEKGLDKAVASTEKIRGWVN